jgi:hypothetical protein
MKIFKLSEYSLLTYVLNQVSPKCEINVRYMTHESAVSRRALCESRTCDTVKRDVVPAWSSSFLKERNSSRLKFNLFIFVINRNRRNIFSVLIWN